MISKKNGRSVSRSENPGLDISSLIDVSFLLLIYFLITSTLDPKEGDLLLTLGDDNSGKRAFVAERPEIRVDALGVVSFGGEIVDANPDVRELVVLKDRLDMFLQSHWVSNPNHEPGVDLYVDDDVRGQRFIDVMNCLGGFGIKNVAIQGMVED